MGQGYQVGDVVVCIDAAGLPSWIAIGASPVEGGIYTVREVRPWGDAAGLLLQEVVNPWFEWIDGNVGEIAFHVRRFRPAKETSLAVFEGMLAEVV